MTTAAPISAPPTGKPSAETQAYTDEQLLESVAGAAWFGKSLVVADPEKIETRIRRKNLSASTSKSVSGCAARFAIDSMLPRVVNPLGPAELGSGAHLVLERFYNNPPEKRTLTLLRRQVNPAARSELKALEGAPQYDDVFAEYTKTIRDWAERIYQIENPQEVQVFKNEEKIKDLKLSNGVPFVGYIDRLRYMGELENMDDLELLIDDYKFGKKVKRPSQMYGDDYGDQMRLYKDAIFQKYGKTVAEARLIWPRQGQIVPADLSPAAVRATLAGFARSWDYMNAVSDAATFPATPSNLCGWCPAANSCPVANIKSANAKAAAATQHGGENGPVALGIPTVREFSAPPRMNKSDGETPVPSTTQEVTVTQNENPKLHFPASKWGAMATATLTDSAATHLDIYGQPLKPATIHSLAYLLGGIAEEVHREVFMGGFDWGFDSVSRVVHSLNASLRSRPAPFGEPLEKWESWRKTLVGLTAAKLRVGIPMADVTEFGAPNFDVLIVHTTVPERTRDSEPTEAAPALA